MLNKWIKIVSFGALLAVIAACGGGSNNGGGGSVAPTLNTMNPTNAPIGSPAITLQVTGSGLLHGVEVLWNDVPKATTEVNSTTLEAVIPADDLDTAGAFSVRLKNPNGDVSNALTFVVGQPNPVPTIANLDPTSVAANSGAFGLKVNGTNFVGGGNGIAKSKVFWNNQELDTQVISETQLSAAVPGSLVQNPGTAQITVVNGAPGGGTSNAATFTIN